MPATYAFFLLKELPSEHSLLVVTELLHISGTRRSEDHWLSVVWDRGLSVFPTTLELFSNYAYVIAVNAIKVLEAAEFNWFFGKSFPLTVNSFVFALTVYRSQFFRNLIFGD